MCIAVVMDLILGDPLWLPHPVIFIGKLISRIEKYFRTKLKNEKLRIPGFIMVVTVAALSFMIPFLILIICSTNRYLYVAANSLILWTTLAARSLDKAGMEVYAPVAAKDIKEARKKLSYIVGRDTNSLSFKEIIRGDVETIAENTSDGIIAPMIYGLIGGGAMSMMYKGINTMDSMVGYITEKFRYIGFFPAKTDDVFNYLPARVTGILMCISAPMVKGSPAKALKIMIRDRKNHKSPNCAYPEAAAAGAMGIQLGGTNTYFGEVMVKPTMGDADVELTEEHIKKTIRIMYCSEMLLLIIAAVILLIVH